MAFQEFELNMIPHGDMPSFYASQYETGRPIIIDVLMGEDAFDCSELFIELHCRKVDDNIVTLEPDSVDGNQVTFVGTEQLFACPGKNLCELCLYADETKDTSLGSLNFFIEVEPDPLAGGLTSETQIYDLYQQVEAITEQVIGDDYYDKDDVDALLDDKADKSTTYTKTQVDNLLNDKADKATTYTKTQVDSALALKANSADLATVATTGSYDDLTDKPTIPAAQVQSDWNQADNTKVDYIKNKPYMDDYLTVSQYNDDMSDLNDNLTEAFNTVEEEIIKTTGTEDELPYQTRPTPSSVGNRCLEMLVGGTVAFNQLLENGNFADGTGWAKNVASTTVSYSNNKAIGTADTNGGGIYKGGMQLLANHKYFYTFNIKNDQTMNCGFSMMTGGRKSITANDELTTYAFIGTLTADASGIIAFYNAGNANLTFEIANVNVIDLTTLFGSTIADYIYTLEQGTAGAGVTLFRKIFSEDYYPYTANTLMSAKPTSKVVKDSNNQTISTYAFGGAELRGLFKKDADGNIYADGDIYEADGTITRRYESRAYQAGDESLPDAITDGTTTVVKLATPTTETSTAYDNPQTVGAYEEFTDVRTIKMPCGHDTIYSKKTEFRYWE